MAVLTASAVYAGKVRHRRFKPVAHEFSYPLFMLYLDLDELPELFQGQRLWSATRPAAAWFRRADHFGPVSEPLKASVASLVLERTGQTLAGPVRLLTHLRYFGYVFNPVSFYYCLSRDAERTEHVIAEVDNTPWGERHLYVLSGEQNIGSDSQLRFRFQKAFHVSPFMPMDQRYDWRFNTPGRTLSVRMENEDASGKLFDATLQLRRSELRDVNLNRLLFSQPPMTLKVVGAIYWNALRLMFKRAPFHPHPSNS